MLSLFESKRGGEYEEEEEGGGGGGQERLIKLKGEQCLAAKKTRLTTIAATRWESFGTPMKCSTLPTITIRANCNCNRNWRIRSSSTTMEMKRLYQQQQQALFAKASSSIAIILFIILSHAIQQGERCVLAQARLIGIYQNNNNNNNHNHNQRHHHHAPESTSSFNQNGSASLGGGGGGTNSTPEQDDRQVLDRHRRATINFSSSSPVQRIIDLIGSHAPVIVVDSTGGESGEQQTTPGAHQAQSASGGAAAAALASPPMATIGQPVVVGGNTYTTGQNVQLDPAGSGALQLEGAAHSQAAAAPAHFGQPAHQLQTQQQQQHWTIVDTSQMLQQQPAQQQQQQQPMAQQQQLMQTSVPNEQYFSFTPFGLAQTGNPFASLQQHQYQQQYNPYMMSLQQQQQQQQPIGQHLLQSSQNLQQQQVATTGAASQQSEPVQPVFLSSYVPELPIAGQSGGAALMQQFANSAQGQFTGSLQQQPPQQLQPNSIQQIQQAQQQQQLSAGKGKESVQSQLGKSDDSGDSDNDSNRDDEGQAAAAAAPARDEQTDDSGEPPDSSDQDSDLDNPTARSGSTSYEDKYDSDDKDGDGAGGGGGGSESQIRRLHKAEARSQPHGPLAATKKGSHMINSNNSSSSGGNGLINVGLNDDCMQCICRATSGCDLLLRCITIGAEEKYCGPFKLSEEYWHKAGSPGDSANNFDSFEECANDADCAAETVSNYMKKYYRDCDGDELVTCVDYARLHKLKPNECSNSQKLHRDFGEYWQSFEGCAEGYNRAQNGDDEDI